MAVTPDQMNAASGFLQSYAASEYQKAAGIQEQTSFLLKARDTLAVAEVRADMDTQYAEIQSGRILKKAEIEARNYQIQGNSLLKNMRSTNAALRARAAANGVSLGSGSIVGVQQQNVDATMRDVAVSDFNQLAAKVLGFEDATSLLQSTEMQKTLNLYTAQRQSGQYEQAGAAARERGGILAGATLLKGGTDFAKSFAPTKSMSDIAFNKAYWGPGGVPANAPPASDFKKYYP